MLIILEHSGSAQHTKDAQEITDYIEEQFGFTVESIVSGDDEIVLYTEDQEEILKLPGKPKDMSLIYFYVNELYSKTEETKTDITDLFTKMSLYRNY